jgi:hypothetical protein
VPRRSKKKKVIDHQGASVSVPHKYAETPCTFSIICTRLSVEIYCEIVPFWFSSVSCRFHTKFKNRTILPVLQNRKLTVKRAPTNEYPAQHRDPSPKSLHMFILFRELLECTTKCRRMVFLFLPQAKTSDRRLPWYQTKSPHTTPAEHCRPIRNAFSACRRPGMSRRVIEIYYIHLFI